MGQKHTYHGTYFTINKYIAYHKVYAQCYIHISFSAGNNVNLYVQFSICSRSILAMYNDQQLNMWDRKFNL